MADLTAVSDFPPWSVDWVVSISNPVERTKGRGYRRQSSTSKRRVTRASATRRLTGIQLPYFEWFVRDQINDGSLSYTDKYKDGAGVQSGVVRIAGGSYKVETNGKNHIVSCELEIFR